MEVVGNKKLPVLRIQESYPPQPQSTQHRVAYPDLGIQPRVGSPELLYTGSCPRNTLHTREALGLAPVQVLGHEEELRIRCGVDGVVFRV